MREEKIRSNNGVEEKYCSKCLRWLPIEVDGKRTFNIRKASPDGLSYHCKDCESATARASYKKRQQKLKTHKRYLENRDEILAKSKEYYEENKERLLEQGKAYREKNPEVWSKSDKLRRERIKSRPQDKYTRAEIIERDSVWIKGNDEKCEEMLVPMCQICMQPIFDDKDIQLDHIISIAAGGSDTRDNVRVAHKKCNIRRCKDGRDLPEEMLKANGLTKYPTKTTK